MVDNLNLDIVLNFVLRISRFKTDSVFKAKTWHKF